MGCFKDSRVWVAILQISGAVISTIRESEGHLGGSVGRASNFRSGHKLSVRELEPHIGLAVVSLSMQSPLQIFCPTFSALSPLVLSQK